MRVFYCIDHDLHYPVGGASVVVAENEQQARELLDQALRNSNLLPYEKAKYTLVEIPLDRPEAYVLADGDY